MKITMKTSKTTAQYFEDFIITKKALRLAEKTIKSYQSQFSAVSKYLDVTAPIDDLIKSDLDNMVASMRQSDLATNSISSYIRVLKVFFFWCNDENIYGIIYMIAHNIVESDAMFHDISNIVVITATSIITGILLYKAEE